MYNKVKLYVYLVFMTITVPTDTHGFYSAIPWVNNAFILLSKSIIKTRVQTRSNACLSWDLFQQYCHNNKACRLWITPGKRCDITLPSPLIWRCSIITTDWNNHIWTTHPAASCCVSPKMCRATIEIGLAVT